MRFLFLLLFFIISSGFGTNLVSPPYSHCLGIRKARQFHLSLFLPLERFDDPQGIATIKMVSRDNPSKKEDDDEVVVYGVNSGRNQIIYNISMKGLDAFGSYGSGKNQFKNPKGIACDQTGNVYVVDCGNNRIVHLYNPNQKVQWVKAFDGKGYGDIGLNSPSQVGIDINGNIYVTDTGNRRIVVFDKKGKIIRTIQIKEIVNQVLFKDRLHLLLSMEMRNGVFQDLKMNV